MSESSESRSFAWPIVLSGVVGVAGIWAIVTNEGTSGTWVGLALVGLAIAGIVRFEIAEKRAAVSSPSRGIGLALAAAVFPWLAMPLGLLTDTQFLVSLGVIVVWTIPIATILVAVVR